MSKSRDDEFKAVAKTVRDIRQNELERVKDKSDEEKIRATNTKINNLESSLNLLVSPNEKNSLNQLDVKTKNQFFDVFRDFTDSTVPHSMNNLLGALEKKLITLVGLEKEGIAQRSSLAPSEWKEIAGKLNDADSPKKIYAGVLISLIKKIYEIQGMTSILNAANANTPSSLTQTGKRRMSQSEQSTATSSISSRENEDRQKQQASWKSAAAPSKNPQGTFFGEKRLDPKEANKREAIRQIDKSIGSLQEPGPKRPKK